MKRTQHDKYFKSDHIRPMFSSVDLCTLISVLNFQLNDPEIVFMNFKFPCIVSLATSHFIAFKSAK